VINLCAILLKWLDVQSFFEIDGEKERKVRVLIFYVCITLLQILIFTGKHKNMKI